MRVQTVHQPFHDPTTPEPADLSLRPGKAATRLINVQNRFLDGADTDADPAVVARRAPLNARIACRMETGCDHSLSQRRPGRNNLTLPNDDPASQIAPELTPKGDETQGTKFTDAALTGANPRLILANLGITHVVCTGIFAAACLPSTARSLADEGPKVMVLPNAAAAGQTARHDRGRVVLSMFDGAVMSADETLGYLPG